jgi:alpha/beta superfamily hydrolase|tara:strand:- start:265 stop:558 length:294 start_codon:yes stop_codon:yes gene_type:complete
MASKELNEDTSFKVSIKTLIGIGAAITTVVGMWFALQADIAEAKELPIIEIPPPDVTRMEFDMKDKNIRLTIQNTQDDVEEIKEDLKRIEEKIDRLK